MINSSIEETLIEVWRQALVENAKTVELQMRLAENPTISWAPQAPVSFGPYLQKLSHQLTNQFVLTFLAEPQKKAGIEPVKVTTEIHDTDLIHQSHVCVLASPGQ